MKKILNFLSNVIWILFGGIWLALLWAIWGILLCITIVGIPFGTQCFKIAGLSFMPYGKEVYLNYGKHPIANVLWVIIGGWEMAIIYLIIGILNCITIIGIPRGIQCFKIMKLAFFPFGAIAKDARMIRKTRR